MLQQLSYSFFYYFFIFVLPIFFFFFFSSRRRHTRCSRDWSSDVCSSDLTAEAAALSEAEHDAALSTILSAAQGMPVVMGVSDCHLGHALARVQTLNALPQIGRASCRERV